MWQNLVGCSIRWFYEGSMKDKMGLKVKQTLLEPVIGWGSCDIGLGACIHLGPGWPGEESIPGTWTLSSLPLVKVDGPSWKN